MTRQEFPRAVRVAVIKRATRDGVTYCEKCGLPAKRFQIDHVIADAHGGKPVIENAELLCDVCFGVKNFQDTKVAAKIKRQTAKALRAVRPAGKITNRGFDPTAKSASRRDREPRAALPPRPMFVEKK